MKIRLGISGVPAVDSIPLSGRFVGGSFTIETSEFHLEGRLVRHGRHPTCSTRPTRGGNDLSAKEEP